MSEKFIYKYEISSKYTGLFKSCPKWRLTADEFSFNQTSNELSSELHNVTYPSSDFLLAENGTDAYVCVPDILQPEMAFLDNVCNVYIRGTTVFFLWLSIAVHLWVVREIRGAIIWPVISHKLSLSIFHVCMLIRFGSYSNHGEITTIAFYAVRAAYCWLNVISYETWRTFQPKRFLLNSQPTAPSYRRILCHNLYSWGLPAILIGSSLLLGVLPIAKDEKWRVCGPTYGNVAQVILMIVCLTSISVVNAIFCVLVITNLLRIRRDIHQTITTDDNKEMFMVYVKLVVISDLLYLMYFVQVIYLHYFFFSSYWLIFDWVSNAQGIWLFLIYCCNNTVSKGLKKKVVITYYKASWSLRRH